MNFSYSGPIESSKSIVNRALIIKSLIPNLSLNYISHAEDILKLKQCLNQLDQIKTNKSLESKSKSKYKQNLNSDQNPNPKDKSIPEPNQKSQLNVFDVGSGGTTFRFLVLLLSRFPGVWILKLNPQLAKRPHQDLFDVLTQLGVSYQFNKNDSESTLTLQSSGWKSNLCKVNVITSSQFLTAVLLSSLGLEDVFEIFCLNRNLGSGYENITIELLKYLKINIQDYGDRIVIHPMNTNDFSQNDLNLRVGADWSSVISLLAFSFSGSEIEITNLDLNSKEPDVQGLELLNKMGLDFNLNTFGSQSIIKSVKSNLRPIEEPLKLKQNPDLFPVFSILASQIALIHKTEVQVEYPKQLIYKESDRLQNILSVLQQLGFEVQDSVIENSHFKDSLFNKSEMQTSGMLKIKYQIQCEELKSDSIFDLNSHSDHRLVMSFELLKSFGYKINYNHPECVKKSFSNFFEIIYG